MAGDQRANETADGTLIVRRKVMRARGSVELARSIAVVFAGVREIVPFGRGERIQAGALAACVLGSAHVSERAIEHAGLAAPLFGLTSRLRGETPVPEPGVDHRARKKGI